MNRNVGETKADKFLKLLEEPERVFKLMKYSAIATLFVVAFMLGKDPVRRNFQDLKVGTKITIVESIYYGCTGEVYSYNRYWGYHIVNITCPDGSNLKDGSFHSHLIDSEPVPKVPYLWINGPRLGSRVSFEKGLYRGCSGLIKDQVNHSVYGVKITKCGTKRLIGEIVEERGSHLDIDQY